MRQGDRPVRNFFLTAFYENILTAKAYDNDSSANAKSVIDINLLTVDSFFFLRHCRRLNSHLGVAVGKSELIYIIPNMGLFDQTSTVASSVGDGVGGGSGKKLLSERLRNMRFMRGGQAAETKSREEKEEREKRELEQQMHWTAEVPDSLRESKAGGGGGMDGGGEGDNETMVRKPVVIIEDGNAWDGPVVGRRSFGKFNPAVEKRNRAALGIDDKERDKEKDEETKKETLGKEEDQAVLVKDEDELEQFQHQPSSYQNMKQSSKNQQYYQKASFAKKMTPPSSLARKRSFSKSVNGGNMQSQHLTVSPASTPGSASFNSSRKRSRRGSYRHAGKSAPNR